MFLKMEKCLQNYAGVFWEELRRKDTVKPKANIFTNAFFLWVCGGVFFASQWDSCLQGWTDQTYGTVAIILIKKKKKEERMEEG